MLHIPNILNNRWSLGLCIKLQRQPPLLHRESESRKAERRADTNSWIPNFMHRTGTLGASFPKLPEATQAQDAKFRIPSFTVGHENIDLPPAIHQADVSLWGDPLLLSLATNMQIPSSHSPCHVTMWLSDLSFIAPFIQQICEWEGGGLTKAVPSPGNPSAQICQDFKDTYQGSKDTFEPLLLIF